MSAYNIETRHYHPRFWPVWLLLGLGWSVAQLPFRLQLALGRGLGPTLKLWAEIFLRLESTLSMAWFISLAQCNLKGPGPWAWALP